MQRKNFIQFLIVILISLVSSAYDYPKTRVEREMDEMGSIAGGEGIYFHSKKEKNTSTVAKDGNVNKYLFQAATAVLSIGEIDTADNNSGVVMTSWYYINDSKDTQAKLTAIIQGDVISTEGIKVMAFQRKKVKGQWQESEAKPQLAADIENKILRKARNIYLSQSSKK